MIECLQCGRCFDVIFFCRSVGRKFCSLQCRGKAFIAQGNPRYGKKHSNATKRKMVIKAQGRNRGEKSHTWKGGKVTTPFGYIYIYSPNHPFRIKQNRVLEHRLVMEKHISRYLNPKEVVHHINGIKDDNRIGNLKLLTDQHSHAKLHYHCNSFGRFTH